MLKDFGVTRRTRRGVSQVKFVFRFLSNLFPSFVFEGSIFELVNLWADGM